MPKSLEKVELLLTPEILTLFQQFKKVHSLTADGALRKLFTVTAFDGKTRIPYLLLEPHESVSAWFHQLEGDRELLEQFTQTFERMSAADRASKQIRVEEKKQPKEQRRRKYPNFTWR